MPVGTAATVKAMYPEHVKQSGADILLANTYHLMLRPGAQRVAAFGGVHGFMNWSGAVLTDSGGFQVMSLARIREVSEEGVVFRSHVDGALLKLTPESCMEAQACFNSDIQMVLDECISYPAPREEAARAMHLSLEWARRSKAAFTKHRHPGQVRQVLFGIVQGGVYPQLRKESAQALVEMNFDGYAIGGLAVGEGQDVMLETVEHTVPFLDETKPRYLMGVGSPEDIILAVLRGVDMFDCVLPTRAGRHGQAYTREGLLNLRAAAHADDPRPLDATSLCPPTRNYARAYLHHLVKNREYLASMLLTWNNLHYYQTLMAELRTAIARGESQEYAQNYLKSPSTRRLDPKPG